MQSILPQEFSLLAITDIFGAILYIVYHFALSITLLHTGFVIVAVKNYINEKNSLQLT